MLLLDEMLNKASQFNMPLVTTFELTQLCNFKCTHCYNFDRTIDSQEKTQSSLLTTAQICETIRSLSNLGMLYLNLTGGEVLLHKDLVKIIKFAKSLFLEIKLKTNASLMTPKIALEVLEAGCYSIDVSLYGFSEISYQKLTQKSGEFNKVLNGILSAKNQGLIVTINIMVNKFNVEELPLMVEFCRTHSLDYQISAEVTERYDGTPNAKDVEISPEQFDLLLRGPFRDAFYHENKEKNLQCSCAKTVCGISSKGEVYPCIGAPIPSGNINEKSFEEIWYYSPVLNKIRNLKKQDFQECLTCTHIEFCNRSSGSIYTNTKNYTGCDSSTLMQAQKREKFFLNGFK